MVMVQTLSTILIMFPLKLPQDASCIQIFEPVLPACSIYLMKYVNKSRSPSRVSSPAADSAFFVDFVPYIAGIYFVWRLITAPVLQHNLQWDGRLRLIC